MKSLSLITIYCLTVLNLKAQTTCDSIVADFSFTNSGLTYYFFDESILNDPDSIYWHWSFDDGENSFSNLRNPVHYFYYQGEHVVSLSIDVFVNGVWCSKTHYDTIYSTGVQVGIPELMESAISIHPNPGSGIFTIDRILPIESCRVYDLSGKAIQLQLFNGNRIILPDSLNSGIYFLQLNTAQGFITRRLVLSK